MMYKNFQISVLVIVYLVSNSQANPCLEFDDSSCQCGVLLDKHGCKVECNLCDETAADVKQSLEKKSSIIPNWSTWGEWSTCFTDCGFGHRYRVRRCKGGHSNLDCGELFYEFESCYTKSCGGELAYWGEWSDWSSCSRAGGGGERYRSRVCRHGVKGQDDCQGDIDEEQICIDVEYPAVLVQGIEDEPCFDERFLNSYRGNMDTAWNGHTCKYWDTKASPYRPQHHPNEDLRENFCRNPGNVLGGPWCYIDDNYVRKSLCRVPQCNVVGTWSTWQEWSACSVSCDEGERSRIRQCLNGYVTTGNCVGNVREIEVCSTNPCPQHPIPPKEGVRTRRTIRDCASILAPDKYRGIASTTINGYPCQRWDSNTPHQHPYYTQDLIVSAGLISNYCRDLDGDGWPWCISTNPDQMWDYCQIARCAQRISKVTDETCYDEVDPKSYRGKVSTTNNGVSCQNWDSNFPHAHEYKFFNYPQSGLENNNYCRVPDDDDAPWCITTDPNTYWDYCDVPSCQTGPASKDIDPLEMACGYPIAHIKSDVSLRVIGGMEANKNSMPWIVALQNRNHFPYCGASIINEYWILTAAHCIESRDPGAYEALIGNFKFSEHEIGEKTVFFQSIFPHPGFDAYTMYHDIALLKVRTPITFNEYVKPICLPTEHEVMVGKKFLIAGWGSLGNNEYPDMLEQAYVPMVSTEYCNQVYDDLYGAGALDDGMICAGYEEGGIDTCQGDSGGPLVDTENFEQIGIVSWGKGCAEEGFPGVYTSVAHYRDWMKNIMDHN